jgi:hypothetical protein
MSALPRMPDQTFANAACYGDRPRRSRARVTPHRRGRDQETVLQQLRVRADSAAGDRTEQLARNVELQRPFVPQIKRRTHGPHIREARPPHPRIAATSGGALGLRLGVAGWRADPDSAARLFPARLYLTRRSIASTQQSSLRLEKDSAMALLDFIRDAGEKLFHIGTPSRLNRRSRASNPVLRASRRPTPQTQRQVMQS